MVNFKYKLLSIFCFFGWPLILSAEACLPALPQPKPKFTLPVYKPVTHVAESVMTPCQEVNVAQESVPAQSVGVIRSDSKQRSKQTAKQIAKQPTKRVLFAFDGTGNDATSLTNVWRFAQNYRKGEVYYLPGPGRAVGLNQASDATDVALAWSAGQRVAIQWQKLLQTLAQQNEGVTAIDVVGFSRGAALARHFANKVSQNVRAGRFWYEHPQLGKITTCVDLRFLGLFDTVAQFHLLGLTDQTYNLTIPTSFKSVSHAVALHEFRWAFPLTAAVGSQVIEKAFVGAHADIGGGYLSASTSPGSTPGDLSEVALRWMFNQAKQAGVDVHDEKADLAIEYVSQTPVLHQEGQGFWGAMLGKDRRVGALLQGQIAHLGTRLRQEVEAFIKRPFSGELVAADVAGWVNLKPYYDWLKQRAAMP
jgi:hypothetical protein